MLTADPEGFPLGLAELGLKKPKAGVRIHTCHHRNESKPSTRSRHERAGALWSEALTWQLKTSQMESLTGDGQECRKGEGPHCPPWHFRRHPQERRGAAQAAADRQTLALLQSMEGLANVCSVLNKRSTNPIQPGSC